MGGWGPIIRAATRYPFGSHQQKRSSYWVTAISLWDRKWSYRGPKVRLQTKQCLLTYCWSRCRLFQLAEYQQSSVANSRSTLDHYWKPQIEKLKPSSFWSFWIYLWVPEVHCLFVVYISYAAGKKELVIRSCPFAPVVHQRKMRAYALKKISKMQRFHEIYNMRVWFEK